MSCPRWLLLALAAVAGLSGCGGSTAQAADPDRLTVDIENVYTRALPPLATFEVYMYETERVEEVTAVGDTGDAGATPLGNSCNQLRDEFPDLVGCEEHSRIFDRNINVPIPLGGLDDNGRVSLEIPARPITLVISALDPADEYCDFSGSEQIAAGTTEFTLEISYGCS